MRIVLNSWILGFDERVVMLTVEDECLGWARNFRFAFERFQRVRSVESCIEQWQRGAFDLRHDASNGENKGKSDIAIQQLQPYELRSTVALASPGGKIDHVRQLSWLGSWTEPDDGMGGVHRRRWCWQS